MDNLRIDGRPILRDVTLEIDIRFPRRTTFRMWLGVVILRFAAVVLPCRVTISKHQGHFEEEI